jgi:16S rRNA (uracil1498-N3)-methyltransferase
MASERFFSVTRGSEKNGVVVLDGPEFHHCVRVCRVRVGDTVKLLDGRGGTYEARVERIDEREAFLRVLAFTKADELPPIDIALGVVKAPRFDLAVEKCTELGVRRLIPFTSERCVWRDGGDAAVLKIERIQRKIIASCKQSGRPFFPEIARVVRFDALLEELPRYRTAYLADRHADTIAAAVGQTEKGPLLGIVGPEGGFNPAERDAFIEKGVLPLSLGPFRLRSETAAVCLLYRLTIEYLAARAGS